MSSPYPVSNAPVPPPAPGSGVGPVPDSYFTESRKGEISELRNLLRGFGTERDPTKKRDIMKKVIAYMTLGIDVSRLFTEMMLAIETRDLVIKKMVYLYLTNYARSHPELAQMCTNTLQKDCGNEDPMVRGLALRALCGLNLPQMVEYICEPLRRGLSDGHAYVRKTAIMGILKLYHLEPEIYESNNFSDTLYDMLRDPDAGVVANCIIVLNEVMQKTPAGGMAINRAIMLHLLNRIHEFNEFAKVQILELVPRYIPANEEEGYQIMNLLDPVLRTTDAGATMATMKAFLSLAEHIQPDNPIAMKQQIIDRVKAPLVTQISSGSSEIMYTLLKHVEILQDICPGSFDDEYRQFYVRYNEPTHVKYLKIQILPRLANTDTAPDIVAELAELVNESNPKLGRLAVRSMGKIACSGQGGPGCAEAIARRLVEMLDLMSLEHITSEAATALTLMIRKHPSLKPFIAPPLVRSLKYVTESKGKASLLYLISECGEIIREAPYAFEKLIDNYDNLRDPVVKMALLTGTIKLFFQRPPEVQRMLGRLLAKATDDVSSQDLHDRALLYYRLLRNSAQSSTTLLETIVKTDTSLPTSGPNGQFAEEQDTESRNELMSEFNTLAIIYGKPSTNFIAPEFQFKYTKMPDDHPLSVDESTSHQTFGSTGHENLPTTVATDMLMDTTTTTTTAAPYDMMGEVDLLGFGSPSSPISSTQAPPAVAATTSSTNPTTIALNMSVTMSGDTYQNYWSSVPDAEAIVTMASMTVLPSSTDVVESALAKSGILTMASGELPNEYKFFLYAQDRLSGYTFLIQSNIEKVQQQPLMILTVKVTTSTSTSIINSSPPTASTIATMVEQLTDIISRALA